MRKRITNAQLQTELVDILKNMFLPSKKMIKEQIEWLIEHKYMRRDEDDINTFIYMAWSQSDPSRLSVCRQVLYRLTMIKIYNGVIQRKVISTLSSLTQDKTMYYLLWNGNFQSTECLVCLYFLVNIYFNVLSLVYYFLQCSVNI